MFERFTGEARSVVSGAVEVARDLRADQTGPSHVLLALFDDDRGAAGQALRAAGADYPALRERVAAGGLDAAALAQLGIDLDAVRQATEAAFGPGALTGASTLRRTGHIRLHPQAKKILELALRESVRRGDGHIGTGHLLLGVLREGSAVPLLADTGVDVEALTVDVHRRLDAP